MHLFAVFGILISRNTEKKKKKTNLFELTCYFIYYFAIIIREIAEVWEISYHRF